MARIKKLHRYPVDLYLDWFRNAQRDVYTVKTKSPGSAKYVVHELYNFRSAVLDEYTRPDRDEVLALVRSIKLGRCGAIVAIRSVKSHIRTVTGEPDAKPDTAPVPADT